MKAARHHIESLDAFRGVTVAGMILVNNPGNWNAVFPPLLHADWNGCTFADLVFPFFLFIMGVAIPFAFERRVAAGHQRRALYVRVFTRAAKLIALGLVLNAAAAWPHISAMRIPGVLQRIAIVYVCTALVTLHTSPVRRTAVTGTLLLAHWAVLMLVPFDGHGAGTVAPGANIASFIDAAVFGSHMLTAAGDPEGLLGTLSATATALAGTLVGHWLRTAASPRQKIRDAIAAGGSMLGVGLLWALVLPLNKPLWTGSYALVTAGLGAIAFAACYAVIDIARVGAWARPFVWLGLNPLAVYFCSELVGHAIEWPFATRAGQTTTVKTWMVYGVLDRVAGSALPEPVVSLLFAAGFAAFWIAVAGALYRRGIRIQA